MKSLTAIFLLSAAVGIVYSAGDECKYVASVSDNSKEWNYVNGGAEWTCGACTSNPAQQSPINVVLPAPGTAGFKNDLTLKVDVPDSAQTCKLLKSASTVKVDFSSSSTKQTMTGKQINGDLKTYEAAQFHFHAPSEHLVNGKQYDLCIHTVNVLTSANTDNGRAYAVLGYLFEKDDYAPDMPWLAKLIKDLPTADGSVTTEFDWESFSE